MSTVHRKNQYYGLVHRVHQSQLKKVVECLELHEYLAFVKSANVVCASAVAKVERECKIFLSFIAFCGSQLLFQFSFYTLNVKTVPKQFSTTNAFKEMLR